MRVVLSKVMHIQVYNLFFKNQERFVFSCVFRNAHWVAEYVTVIFWEPLIFSVDGASDILGLCPARGRGWWFSALGGQAWALSPLGLLQDGAPQAMMFSFPTWGRQQPQPVLGVRPSSQLPQLPWVTCMWVWVAIPWVHVCLSGGSSSGRRS